MKDFISGHLFEEATLGLCPATSCDYMPYHAAVEAVRKNQPRQPRPAIARLEKEIARYGLPVKFYTAVRSTLDQFHSVDGFFDFDGVLITIDVTMNPSKVTGKADIVIQADDFENLSGLAEKIICELKMKRVEAPCRALAAKASY